MKFTPRVSTYVAALTLFSSTLISSAVFCFSTASAKIVEKKIDYKSSTTPLVGQLYFDDSIKGPRPGVLVVHEWYGLNDYAKMRAKKLAELGYVALAVDMYGYGKNDKHPSKAKEFMDAAVSDPKELRDRFSAALDALKSSGFLEKENVAAIGYCFGGSVVLNMARAGIPLKGVVSFHGGLGSQTPAKESEIKAKILVATGGADPMVPADQVAAFSQEMSLAKVDFELMSFPDALHAFTNPSATEMGKKHGLPLAYNKDADERSWSRMKDFLKRVLN